MTGPNKFPKPPSAYSDFVARFPKLGQAWDLLAEGGKQGPLDERTARLVKLAIAIGAGKEGAVHASVRKALAIGITLEEMEQVVALSAGTLGLPTAVAAHTWVKETRAGGKGHGD
ncbi:MAG: carboxymuconolactone decarboxylase family protein [Acidobacteriota bacterium]|nr:carboxymuconolactone decarboxylase family protein [Acidobacteriota bacterium]